MLKNSYIAGAAILLAGVAAVSLAKGDEPKESVAWAKSWDAAVEEAKTLNVPIVVHSHGFYWGPCWGMHGAVLQNKKYIAFANDNTVEVIAQQDTQKAIDKGHAKSGTYVDKESGKEFMLEFPNLTVADVKALHSSKAASYNDTGGIPYTAIVNPHTLKRMRGLSGSQPAKRLMEVVEKMKGELWAEHGAGLKRSDIAKFDKDANKALAKMEKGGAAKALAAAKGLKAKAAKMGEKMTPRYEEWLEKVFSKAEEELDAAEEFISDEKMAKAKKILGPLARGLKGTELEARVIELIAETKTEE